MKILQTGFTTQQAGGYTMLKYDPVAKLFAQALRHYGFEVDHRPPVPEESLKEYDAVFCGIGGLNALSARHAYGALDVITRARSEGCALVFYIDDWQTHHIPSSAKTLLKNPDAIAKPFMEGARAHWEWATKNTDRMLPSIQALVERKWPTTVMALYDGGDWAKFSREVNTERIVGVDPTPFYSEYPITLPMDSARRREWVFAILSDQRRFLDRLGNDWPIAHRGGKASKAPERVYEKDLAQLYADNWGVLSCPYPHSGSGWFRARHEMTMRARSVLYSVKELSFIDPVFDASLDMIEGLEVPQLRELADAQWSAWMRRRPSKEDVAVRIGETMDEEIAKII